MLADETIKSYLDLLSSGSPTPGGGSVSALSSSLGVSLGMMVVNLTVGKKFYEEYDETIKYMIDYTYDECAKLKQRLTELIDEDTKAYDAVMEAIKLPKNTEEEKNIRTEALQTAYVKAMEVPLETAKLSLKVLENLDKLKAYVNPNAISDIGVGVLMAHSGLLGSIDNVKINLSYIKNNELVNSTRDEIKELEKSANILRDKILKETEI
ncbi:MAG: cyclodeaminase/cyclohydrolase family protein [Thermoanaerobacteraceae bacterium]|nr:cyclodeaminase/cyclohydrolase family protein [Thermoanaerobacteraceae bacterium]